MDYLYWQFIYIEVKLEILAKSSIKRLNLAVRLISTQQVIADNMIFQGILLSIFDINNWRKCREYI